METPEARALWNLVEQRLAGGDREAIDREIWDRFGGEWAVMFTDLAGFSRQVAKFGIIHFLQTIHEQKRVLVPIIAQHGGTLVKIEADSMLVLFPTAESAARSALAMQAACVALSKRSEPEDKVLLCVGLGFGRVLRVGDAEVFGHEVNLASKLGEDTAKAQEILATPAAHAAFGDIDGITWEQVTAEYAGESVCWRAVYKGR
ncbi:MAG: adenylate/guanylate cyclase domain-containing protein [Deltaproteobacteria bacterium]|nr:adenylate/guanylate cyclase domain-containing protein [Deltaproteobacteria bacterium]